MSAGDGLPVLEPADEAEASAAIRDARGRGARLLIRGGGTRAGLGRPVRADAVLSTVRLDGITLYEPAELVIAARAGTPLAAIEARLAERGQRLPFEPVDLRPLYGTAGEPTLGGVVAGNWSGPRRIAAGAARDHVLGVRFVNGRGEAVKSGGRVMKNVTGLDLAKLMCGAHGTLGLMTEITLKVLPTPDVSATLVLTGLDDGRAAQALAAALGSPFEVTGAAHRPAGVGGTHARTLIRLEGFAASVDYRFGELARLLAGYGAAERIDGEESALAWRQVRDALPLVEPAGHAVWRLSVAPTRGPSAAALIGQTLPGRCFYDWGCGLVWLATPAEGDAGARAIRAALAVTGGHATLIRAPEAIRAAVDVFQPEAPAVAALSAGIRASFDPDAMLNPGRMVA